MNQSQLRGDLPEPVRRYFLEVAQMQPPADLLDSAVAEIERTPRINRFSAMPIFGFVATAAVVIGLLVFSFMNPAPPDVGEDATPSPSAAVSQAAPTETPEPTPLPIETLAPLEGLPSAGEVIATYDVGSAGYPVLYAHDSIWLSNAGTGTLSRMDPDTGELTGSIVVNADPEATPYDLNAVADDQFVWATGQDNTLVKIDPATDEIVERIPIETLVYRMVLHDGLIWITDLNASGRLMAVDTQTSEVVIDERYSQWPAALAVTDTDVWMASYQGELLYRIDPTTGQQIAVFPTSSFSMAIVPLGDALYSTGNQDRPLERFSVGDGATTVRLAEVNVSTADDRLFGFRGDGAFMELDPVTLEPRSVTMIEGGGIGTGLYANGRFYVAQGDSDPQIVVVDPSG
ncbi:MAG: PQQ-binding-like beta-propeller repeat protein [Chloroflexota bacterium]|nr:PQQ-binding-like beta-propeller repeat protein [Chloroflexota bacterium]